MFLLEKWCLSNWAKKTEGIKARGMVLFDPSFCPHIACIAFCIKTTIPLVSILRKVDFRKKTYYGLYLQINGYCQRKNSF